MKLLSALLLFPKMTGLMRRLSTRTSNEVPTAVNDGSGLESAPSFELAGGLGLSSISRVARARTSSSLSSITNCLASSRRHRLLEETYSEPAQELLKVMLSGNLLKPLIVNLVAIPGGFALQIRFCCAVLSVEQSDSVDERKLCKITDLFLREQCMFPVSQYLSDETNKTLCSNPNKLGPLRVAKSEILHNLSEVSQVMDVVAQVQEEAVDNDNKREVSLYD